VVVREHDGGRQPGDGLCEDLARRDRHVHQVAPGDWVEVADEAAP
jgi:hypothetical protein